MSHARDRDPAAVATQKMSVNHRHCNAEVLLQIIACRCIEPCYSVELCILPLKISLQMITLKRGQAKESYIFF